MNFLVGCAFGLFLLFLCWDLREEILSHFKKPKRGRPKVVHIHVTEQKFRDLISGKILSEANVDVAVVDMGYQRMIQIIEEAWLWSRNASTTPNGKIIDT